MKDPRIESYASLLIERCLNVQRGWQVVVQSSPLARPLVEAVVRAVARRGAYALVRLNYESISSAWTLAADEGILGAMAPLELRTALDADAFCIIQAPENTRDRSEIPPDRMRLLQQAAQPVMAKRIAEENWVGCQYPTPALAQDAGMSLEQFEDVLFGACLIDWEPLTREMRRLADRFDAGRDLHITGEGTDIRISLDGRVARVDEGHVNMPGGEFFFSPVESATEGVVTYSEFPAVYHGHEVSGVRLVFEGGRVVDASATAGEEFLIKTLDADPGARVLGELGIGCNPGIDRHMRNTLFDEKINGTVHLAVGMGFPFIGGTNVSTVHWDMVKDLRRGGAIQLDGELVQQDGRWLI